MDGQAIMTVSATVLALVQLAKWAGLSANKAPIGVLVLSLVGVIFWGWSRADLTQATAFDYLAGLVAVMTSAAGVYGFTRAAGDQIGQFRNKGGDQ